jgi:hypothetical protein
MTTQTHTQTAWTVSPYYAPNEDADPLGVFRIKEVEAEAQKWDDAITDTEPNSQEERDAIDNREEITESARRLIAAAPEMLEALRGLLDQLEAAGIYIPGEDSGQWHGAEGLSFRKASEAIAKAEGRAGE